MLLTLHILFGSLSLFGALFSWWKPGRLLFHLLNLLIASTLVSGLLQVLGDPGNWLATCSKLTLYLLFLAFSQFRHLSRLSSVGKTSIPNEASAK